MLINARAIEEEGRNEVHTLHIADSRIHMCVREEHIKQWVAPAGDSGAPFITEQTTDDVGSGKVHFYRVLQLTGMRRPAGTLQRHVVVEQVF